MADNDVKNSKKPFFGFGKKKTKSIAVYENIDDPRAGAEIAEQDETVIPSQYKEVTDGAEIAAGAPAGEAEAESGEAGAGEAEAESGEAGAGAGTADAPPEAQAEKTGDRFPKFAFRKDIKKKLNKKNFLTIAGILIVLIVLFSAATIIVSKLSYSKYPAGSVLLPMPETPDGDYIYIKRDLQINGQDGKLLGVMLDSQACVLYFDRYLKPDSLDFYIVDDSNKKYYLDLSRHMNVIRTNKLYFQPIAEGVTSFELVLPEYVNSGVEHLFFYTSAPISYPPALFAQNQYANIDFEGKKATLAINGAAFSNAGVFLNYSIISPESEIKIYPNSDGAFIRLSGKTGNIPYLDGFKENSIPLGEPLLGTAAFWPPANYKDVLRVTMNDLLCFINLNKTVQPQKLFLNDPQYSEKILFAGYKLVLERMRNKGNIYVLVLHTEDTRLPDLGDNSNRVYAGYDIELIGKGKNGETVVLSPSAYESPVGSDFVFTDSNKQIDYSDPENVLIVVKSVSLKMGDVGFDIDLSELNETQDAAAAQSRDAVVSYFNSVYADYYLYTAQITGCDISSGVFSALVRIAYKNGETDAVVKETININAPIVNGLVDINAI